jgi:hypothetical protein
MCIGSCWDKEDGIVPIEPRKDGVLIHGDGGGLREAGTQAAAVWRLLSTCLRVLNQQPACMFHSSPSCLDSISRLNCKPNPIDLSNTWVGSHMKLHSVTRKTFRRVRKKTQLVWFSAYTIPKWLCKLKQIIKLQMNKGKNKLQICRELLHRHYI